MLTKRAITQATAARTPETRARSAKLESPSTSSWSCQVAWPPWRSRTSNSGTPTNPGSSCTETSTRLSRHASPTNRLAMNSGGATLATIQRPSERPLRPASAGSPRATSEPPKAVTAALTVPTAATTPLTQSTSSTQRGSTSTTPQIPAQATQAISTLPAAREFHSRSSSERKRLASPMNSTVPNQKPSSTSGGPTVT